MRGSLTLAQCLLSLSVGVNLVASFALPQDEVKVLAPRADSPPPRIFNDTAKSLQEIGNKAASSETRFIAELLKTVTVQTATFHNTVEPYWLMHNDLNDLTAPLELYSVIGADFPGLGDPGGAALGTYRNAYVATFTNIKFYNLVQAVYQQYFPDKTQKRSNPTTYARSPPTLSTEDTTLLKLTMKIFGDYGCGLPAQQQNRLAHIKSQISSLDGDYARAIEDFDGNLLHFTAKELDGVPDDRLAKLVKDNGAIENGRYTVDSYNDFDMYSDAKNGTTRQLIYLGADQVVPENIDRLKQYVALRAEQANLLGHRTYADYVLQYTLIKSPQNVQKFFDQLAAKLQPLNQQQYIEPLKSAKQKETGDSKFLFEWDTVRYEAQAQPATSMNERDPSEYYEAEHTVTGMLNLLGGVFNLRFTRVDPATAVPNVPAKQIVWDPSVLLFSVHDANGQFLGHTYMDLYYRQNSDSGTNARFPVCFGGSYVKADGTPNPINVVAKLIISKADSGVTLLSSDTIHGVIRVIGNVFAIFASRTKYAGLSTARGIPPDVYNIVASTFEAWSSNAAFLEALSDHYSYVSPEGLKEWNSKTSNQKQPPQKLPQSPSTGGPTALQNGHNVAYALLQSFSAVFDQFLFTQSYPVNTKTLDITYNYNTIGKKYRQLNQVSDLGVTQTSKWDYGYTQDTGPFRGPAIYFTYSFSFAYSADLFSPFAKNPFDNAQGTKFRNIVLASGASNPDYVGLMEKFLGRPLDMSKFYATLGAH